MALDLWFRDDVQRILNSKRQAAGRDKTGERQAGYLEALDDLAVAFGLAERGLDTTYRQINARLIQE